MFSIIVTIFISSFLPFFMMGNLAQNIGKEIGFRREVLGESNTKEDNSEFCKEEDTKNLQNYNLFPLDPTIFSSLSPVRKPDYADITIWAGSYVAIDVDSGTILGYYNGRKRTQIASLTKVMTAVLTMEKVKDLEEEAIITREALNVPGTVVGCPTSEFCNGNRMYTGEKIKVKDVLKAMLMNSANDAASALAIHIAGSQNNFVKMMNDKAKEIGLKDTNFCTPSGLEIDGKESECYSSAYDIARIAAYSLKYNQIWDIMKTEEDVIYSTDGTYSHNLKNTDMLLSEMPECIGGKTGFTPMAGKSLMTAAIDPTRQHKIIAVILNDPSRWTDMKTLINWVFDNYEWK